MGASLPKGVVMLWMPVAFVIVVAVGALMAIITRRHPVRADDPGAVSHHWLAEHRSE